MRRVLTIALTLVTSPALARAAADETAPTESLVYRLGRALLYGVLFSALLVGGAAWRRRGRGRRQR